MSDFTAARRAMIDGQLRTNSVIDHALLDAFQAIPRERFVPAAWQALTYAEAAIPLNETGDDRQMLEPMVLGRMIQAAEITSEDIVLDIGCGSGYAAAVMARLAGAVVALEQDENLARRAGATLASLEHSNVVVVQGPLNEGHQTEGPYDVILVEGAVEEVPSALKHQLKEGGRLIAILGKGRAARVMLYRRLGEDLSGSSVFDAAAPMLPGFAEPAAFAF